jgi:hemerythrin-like metal-binding protein
MRQDAHAPWALEGDASMADYFPWDPSKFGLDISEMDRQHETLIGIMNKLAARDAAGAPKQELSGLLAQLAKYTTQHFAQEEEFMASKRFPKLEVHQRIHHELLAQLGEHVTAFQNGAGSRLDEKLLGFLKFWLSAHILGIDKQYAAHVHRRSA